MAIAKFLDKINAVILNPLIFFAFSLAFIYFFVGIIQFLTSAQTDTGRDEGKKKLLYGLIGMLIMFGAYGIIHLILATFQIDNPQTYITF